MYSRTIESYYRDNIQDMAGGNDTLSSPRQRNEMTKRDIEEIRHQLNTMESGVEITITFRPVFRGLYSSGSLTRMVGEVIEKTRVKKDEYLEIMIIGEYSKTGMFHHHGIIKASGRLVDLIRRKLTKTFGRIEVKMIRNVPLYIDYILKDENSDGYTKRIIYDDEIFYYNRKIKEK